MLRRSCLFAFCACVFSVLLFAAGASEAESKKYVVIDRIALIYNDTNAVLPTPKGGWKILPEDMDGIVYGEVVECEPSDKKGWLVLKEQDVDLGFLHESAMTAFPSHESMEPSPFQIVKDKTVPFLLPDKKPVSNYDNFALPYGSVVTVEGRTKVKDKTWLLCFFGTDMDNEEGISLGSERRSGWIPAEAAVDLAAGEPNLSKVEAAKLPEKLDGTARSVLLKNGFYVDPKPVFVKKLTTDDMDDAYSEIDPKTPRFITADLPLHAFHLYFDRMLQKVEEKVMAGRALELLDSMLSVYGELKPELEGSDSGEKTAALVEDYLLITRHLLKDGDKLTGRASDFVGRINEAKGSAISPFTGKPQEFSVFKPRGHYILNDILKSYFRASYMLGTPFPLGKDFGAAAALVLCHILADPDTQAKWKAVYDPICYLAGSSNVNSCYDLSEAALNFKLGDIGDPKKLKEIMTVLDGSAKNSVIQREPGKEFAVLPRRVTFDAMIFESLTGLKDASGKKRTMPDPLDVMAVLGSPAALEEVKKFDGFARYKKNIIELKYKGILDGLTEKWQSYLAGPDGDNIYTSWLSFAKAYFEPTLSRQFFANSPAWAYKKLTTAEGAVTELKHDTILYAEQSGAELGGGGEYAAGPFALPIARGYVEPEAELYRAIADSSRKVTTFLKGMFPEEVEYYTENLSEFAEIMNSLAGIADRAVQDAMTYDDFLTILNFSLPCVLPEGVCDISENFDMKEYKMAVEDREKSAKDQIRMALVADVATDHENKEVLYMAVGAPRKISVYVNDRSGGFRLTEGYMFSYYSFIKSYTNGRMDDGQWKNIVYSSKKQAELQKYLPSWSGKINK